MSKMFYFSVFLCFMHPKLRNGGKTQYLSK
ncbi:hypothetical protein E2C01_011151 [Portunus trituberculatus]|uniref:Uncharacterized protein n=1 Tax=Portunus trituberculatus TaxID=210409 RepID=A0A5B7DAA4_PORTR|nr:hypothetical protein [Portunus trituberculatus]